MCVASACAWRLWGRRVARSVYYLRLSLADQYLERNCPIKRAAWRRVWTITKTVP